MLRTKKTVKSMPSKRAKGVRELWQRLWAKISDDNGAVAIEFVLVAPVMLALVMGIIQFGYVFFVQLTMNNAAREATRQLVVGSVTVGDFSNCADATAGSAEFVACGYLEVVFTSNFTLTACSPLVVNIDLCPEDNDVAVQITLPSNTIALADLFGLFQSGTLFATVTMRQEDNT